MEIEIQDLDPDGAGVGRLDGRVVFVPGLLPGERARIRLTEEKARYARGEVLELLQAAPLRVEPPCPVYGRCGGCSWQHVASPAQMALKTEIWRQQLRRLGRVEPRELLPPVDLNSWGYRSRARLHWDGQHLGFRAAQSHTVVAIDDCLTLEPALAAQLPAIAALCRDYDGAITAVDLAAGEDINVLRLQVAAFGRRELPHWPGWQIWLQRGAEIRRVPATAPALSQSPAPGIAIRYEPDDFTQVNRPVNRALVQLVLAELEPAPGLKILDLFCGLGNFSLPLAAAGAEVLGIEGVAAMVRRAEAEALRHGLKNVRFRRADLFKKIPWADLAGHERWLLDPPRAGAQELLRSLPPRQRPERLVYVSCNPATLARDAALLVAAGYDFVSGRLLNMFAQTGHVESLAVFRRR